jgi:hypothetical protein
MAGLSNRLSAYSLSDEEPESDRDEVEPTDAEAAGETADETAED